MLLPLALKVGKCLVGMGRDKDRRRGEREREAKRRKKRKEEGGRKCHAGPPRVEVTNSSSRVCAGGGEVGKERRRREP